MTATTLLRSQPNLMTPAQLAAVSYLARYGGHTHTLYAYQLRCWFAWCEARSLDPLVGIQRAYLELYIRHLRRTRPDGLLVNTMMHAVRGLFRFAHIDGPIVADPAVYARLPKIHGDESRTQGLDRLELIRFLQVAQTLSLRASEAAAVRIEDHAETLRGHRVLHLVGKGDKPATMPLTVPVMRVLEACRGERTDGPLVLRPLSGKPIDRRDAYRMVARIAKAAGIPRHISSHSLRHAAIQSSRVPECHRATPRSSPATPTHGPPSTTTERAGTSTATASTSSPPMSLACEAPPSQAKSPGVLCVLGETLEGSLLAGSQCRANNCP